MSIIFYFLVAFTIWDINIMASAESWYAISRAYVGFMFFLFMIADISICYGIYTGRSK